MFLRKVLKGIDCSSSRSINGIKIKNIKINSKDVENGDLFVAVKGRDYDGHDFIEEAIKRGAVACLASKKIHNKFFLINVKDTKKALSVLSNNFYGSPSKYMTTIGITGTNGKTTTAYLAASVLAQAGFRAALIGTINYKIGSEVRPSFLTTPDAVTINDILRSARRKGAEYAVLEVSSHALEQGRVEGIDFDIAAFTNLTSEHLDYHKDMEGYFGAKMKIFDRLKQRGVAVLNIDDEKAARIKKSIKARAITYGLRKNADVCGYIKTLDLEGSSFSVHGNGLRLEISTKLIGRHNVYNILAAIATCVALKIKCGFIKKGIENLKVVPGRLETIDCGQAFRVFVDYAHTHDALSNILNMLKDVKEKRLITVFGCGGDRDRIKRPLMGRVATSLSDSVIITTDNPRTEDPGRIISDIEKGINKRKHKYTVIPDRKKAIGRALQIADKGDIVLIAGKGHETTQVIGCKKIYFNDIEVTKNFLCSRLKK